MKNTIIDTNIIVRLLVKDNTIQFAQAQEILQNIEYGTSKGYISVLVLHELIWILENFYEIKRTIYIPQVLKLLSFPNIKVIEVDKQAMIEVLKKFQAHSIDFTDIYLLQTAKNMKDSTIVSFDKDLAKGA